MPVSRQQKGRDGYFNQFDEVGQLAKWISNGEEVVGLYQSMLNLTDSQPAQIEAEGRAVKNWRSKKLQGDDVSAGNRVFSRCLA